MIHGTLRHRTVARLLEEADRISRMGKLDPFEHAAAIREAWGRAGEWHYARLAICAAVEPPDDVVREEFLAELDRRAKARAS